MNRGCVFVRSLAGNPTHKLSNSASGSQLEHHSHWRARPRPSTGVPSARLVWLAPSLIPSLTTLSHPLRVRASRHPHLASVTIGQCPRPHTVQGVACGRRGRGCVVRAMMQRRGKGDTCDSHEATTRQSAWRTHIGRFRTELDESRPVRVGCLRRYRRRW